MYYRPKDKSKADLSELSLQENEMLSWCKTYVFPLGVGHYTQYREPYPLSLRTTDSKHPSHKYRNVETNNHISRPDTYYDSCNNHVTKYQYHVLQSSSSSSGA